MLFTTDRRLAKFRQALLCAGLVLLLSPVVNAADSAADTLRRGVTYYDQQRYEQALAEFDAGARQHPADERFLQWAGKATGRMAESAGPLSVLGLVRRTLDYFERAYALNPRNPDVVSDLAEFHERAPRMLGGDPARAQALRRELKALESTRVAQATNPG